MTCLLMAVAMAGQKPDVETLLAQMRTTYRSIHAAKFLVKFEAPVGRSTAKGQAEVMYQEPHRIAAEFLGLPGGAARLVCDGKKIATFAKSGLVRSRPFSIEALDQSLPTNVETYAFYDALHELSTEKGGGMHGSTLTIKKQVEWNDKKWTVLHEDNKEAAVSIDYYIDPDTHLMWRTHGIDTQTKKPFIDSWIVELDLSPEINPRTFYVPPSSLSPFPQN